MRNLNEILEQLALDRTIFVEDIPKMDLYIDQVLQLFENSFGDSKRSESEKILTKTMVNNYAKGKLFFPIRNKKYSPEHLMLISLIYQLKGGLSISDVKAVLDVLNGKMAKETFDLETFYRSCLAVQKENTDLFAKEVEKRGREAAGQVSETAESEELEQVLLIVSLVQMSNMYRKTAERLVDELLGKERGT